MSSMRKSRLSVYKQDRLVEHFVSGSTARTAASLVGVNKSTAAYFYCRLREIIVLEIEQESHEVFDGEIEVDESYFGGRRKGKRGRATTCWMCLTLSIFASTTPNFLQTRRITLTELRTFGTRPSVICVNSTVFPRRILGYF